MRKRSFLRNLPMCLLQGTWKTSRTESSSTSSLYKLRSNYYFGLALVSLLLPWTVSGGETVSVSPSKIQIVDTIPLEEAQSGRGMSSSSSTFSGRSSKSSGTGNNELLANIDFLTQLTNSKSEKSESEMDPLKCFPKALCGLSAESAAITRRRKTGLIADYIRLMKAVSLNPSVMEKTMQKILNKQVDEPQQDDQGDDDNSDSDEDEDEDEDDDMRRAGLSKRNSVSTGYGYGSARVKPKKSKKSKSPSPTLVAPSRKSSRTPSPSPSKSSSSTTSKSTRPSKKNKRRSKKENIPENSDEFTKQFLNEKNEVLKLMEDGFFNEETEAQNWWHYEKEMEPELEDLVDDSGTELDPSSIEGYYTFGGKRKPSRPSLPYRPDAPAVPDAPQVPFVLPPLAAPPRPRPPQPPAVRRPPSSNYGGSGGVAAVGNFFRGLFGFGNGNAQGGSGSEGGFSNDPFFQGFQRSMADGTPTLITVDKTKEILTTAIEIGETLRSPNQCNTLFNGCKYQYVELLHVIDEIRQNLADKGKIDFQTNDISVEEDNDSSGGTKVGRRKKSKNQSYGYEANLSATSQAETLSPDYMAASSKMKRKNRKRTGKRRKNNNKKRRTSLTRSYESMEQPSFEIASDEPTMYGSTGHQYNPYTIGFSVPLQAPPRDVRRNPSVASQVHYQYDRTSPQLQDHNYHNSYYNEQVLDRTPAGLWARIMQWFGFIPPTNN